MTGTCGVISTKIDNFARKKKGASWKKKRETMLRPTEIPVINLSPFCTETATIEERLQVVEKVHHAGIAAPKIHI